MELTFLDEKTAQQIARNHDIQKAYKEGLIKGTVQTLDRFGQSEEEIQLYLQSDYHLSSD